MTYYYRSLKLHNVVYHSFVEFTYADKRTPCRWAFSICPVFSSGLVFFPCIHCVLVIMVITISYKLLMHYWCCCCIAASVHWLSNGFLWMDSWSYFGKESRWNILILVCDVYVMFSVSLLFSECINIQKYDVVFYLRASC